MAYISTERVAEIRNQLKREYPLYRFSVRREHHSSIYVTILSGPINLLVNDSDRERGYVNVNHFYIGETYSVYPEQKHFLKGVHEIINSGNRTRGDFNDDYGPQPDFYVNIKIGDSDRPYVRKINPAPHAHTAQAPTTTAGTQEPTTIHIHQNLLSRASFDIISGFSGIRGMIENMLEESMPEPAQTTTTINNVVKYSPLTNEAKPFIYENQRYTRDELNEKGLGAAASIAILTA